MSGLDDAFENTKFVVSQAMQNIEKIKTEEDTKLQIINRILVECLGWDTSDISAEQHHENGYSDYIVSSVGVASFLVEAKRCGSIEIKTAEKEKVRHLKLSGPGFKNAMAGIDQATSYATPNGVPIAVLTDGMSWVVFKPYVPGAMFKSKEAIVFPSLRAVLSDFAVFFDLLSKQQFDKKIYNAVFDQLHQHRVLLTRGLVPAIEESEIKLTPKSELAFDLEKVFATFFSRLTGDHNEDMLIECFVESSESRIADFALEKMTASVLGNISPENKDVDGQLASLIEDKVEAETALPDAGQTVFIVGPTGAGKSTFLERFFRKTLSDPIRGRCVVVRLNCLDSTGRPDTALNWLTETLIKLLEEAIYHGGSPTWDELQGLYHSEYVRRSIGVDKHLYDRNKQAFKEKFGDYLNGKVETDREGYLRRILSDIVENRKKLPIILTDNTDEFPAEFKKNVFQFVQSLCRQANHCLVIFPVTDKSAWSFSKTDIFGIYKSRSFFLPTPAPREVFRKRIEFLKRKLAIDQDFEERKKYFSSRGFKISIENLNGFALVLENIFVDHDYTSKIIGELANYNIRRTLSLSQRIITSSVFDIDELLNSFITGHPISLDSTKFMNALLKGDYEVYKLGDGHEVFPVYQVDSEFRQSPLIFLRILALLDSARLSSRTLEERHLSVQSIYNYFDAIGSTESAVDKALLSLLEAGLIEPYDTSVRTLSTAQRLTISFSGRVHLQLGSHNSVFFLQMALATSIVNPDTAAKIKSRYYSKTQPSKKDDEIRGVFLEYLLEEDKSHISIEVDLEQYKCQDDLLENLRKFNRGNTVKSTGILTPLGKEYQEGTLAEGAVATVEWYDVEKGFGFLNADDFDERVFLHVAQLKEQNIDGVSEGDSLLCDIARGIKGLHITKVHEVQIDDSRVETAECQIIRLFPDRKYGFVKLAERSADALFFFSAVPEIKRENLVPGARLVAEVQPDKSGGGFQVKRVVSFISGGYDIVNS